MGADEAFDFSDEDDDIESSIPSAAEERKIDTSKTNYRTADLNKLGDAELKAHKAAMEVGF